MLRQIFRSQKFRGAPQRGEIAPLEPLKEKRQAPVRRQKTSRNLARTNPKRQPLGDGLKTAKHHLNPASDEAKNPPPQRAEIAPLEPLKEKRQAPVRRQKTSRNLARTNPKRQPLGDGLKTAKHHLNPASDEAKNPPPQRAEIAPLEPLKEKRQAPVRRQKTSRNLARTNPKRQPLGDGLKTAKHHLNPASDEAKNLPPQRAEIAPLEPLKEKRQAPFRRQKTSRNLARTNPKRQPLGDGLKTAKHHLNPASDEAKNRPPQRAEIAPLEPLKEKRQAPVSRQKTSRNLARTNPKRQPLGDGLKTAKHHLNPASDEAKNPPPQRAEIAPLEPLKEKRQAPFRRQKTSRNLARTNPKRQPLGDGLKTAKHHLNPASDEAKNPPPQRAEIAPLEPLKEKRQAPFRRQKTSRNLARTNPKRQPLGDGFKTAKHHLNPASDEAKNPPPQRAEIAPLEPLKEKRQAPVRRQKTSRNLARTNPKRQPFGDGFKTAKHHLNPASDEAKNPPPQRAEIAPLEPLKEKRQAPFRRQKTWRNLARTNPKRQPLGDGLKTAKHHLNPASDEAKKPSSAACRNSTFGTPKGEETSPIP